MGSVWAVILGLAVVVLVALAAGRWLSSRGNGGRGRHGLAVMSAVPPEPATPPSYSPKNVGNDASARPWESTYEIAPTLAGSDAPSWGVPEGFDVDAFLSASKANFISLQDAWDRADVPRLRAMMTDDMLAQIQQQLAERESHTGVKHNKTEVVTLNAQLLGIEELPNEYMASVEFSGLIREEVGAGPNPFREVWNITRAKNGQGGWLVAGVQALH